MAAYRAILVIVTLLACYGACASGEEPQAPKEKTPEVPDDPLCDEGCIKKIEGEIFEIQKNRYEHSIKRRTDYIQKIGAQMEATNDANEIVKLKYQIINKLSIEAQ